PASLQPGQRVQLRAVAYDHEGAAIPAGRETFVWSGTGDFAGIAPTGELTVPEDHAAGRIGVGLKVTEDGQSRSLPVYSVHVVIGEAPAFRDMAGHWAAQVVAALASRGVIQGYPDGTFGPERSVTRAEFATLLVRGLRTERQLPDVGEPLPFADRDVIPAWAAGSIGVAARQGLLGGYEDGTFRPERPITREEAAVILSRLPEVAEVAPDPIAYTDADAISAWARLGVVLASGAGLVEGYPDGSFRPQAPITRAEAAALIERLLGVLQASS
ncbi:MAG TPA: S-layer homology domain-containing protein, partial [Bacillota bacterium]